MTGKRARRHFSQLSEFKKGLIIGMKTAALSTHRVAGQVDRSEFTVRNCWEQCTREGTHAWKTVSGVTRKTTRKEDRRIVRQALVYPRVTRSTIRADWCQARSIWNVPDWQNVVFSDESRFVLGTDDNRVRVWRRPGDRYNSNHTALRHTARTAGVLVWGAIAYDSRCTLNVMRGTLTGQRYVEDILRPHVVPFLNGLPGAIFQQDIARPNTARDAQDFLRHFQTLPWLARSPDLSPLVHVLNQLKRQLPSCHSVHDLELAVQDLWAHLPHDNIRCLINSMPDLVVACIAAGGGPTRD
ncbi:transposable element Tcb1 transposase [Trichonephila clavipes]|uniref:Transposable element Tcb1 transposase n=1 Tax=Trichonephila clavipes TaxID=2585209 RepID=A0A8X6VZE0_TRICX|nr:transposable element Tcb1 transposase [Trichonephila clavipes]